MGGKERHRPGISNSAQSQRRHDEPESGKVVSDRGLIEKRQKNVKGPPRRDAENHGDPSRSPEEAARQVSVLVCPCMVSFD